jgi:hypothetical protein
MTDKQKDPIFYVNSPSWEIVWTKSDCDYFVIRNGELRINYKDKVVRYSDDLASIGITCDDDIEREQYVLADNPWFEVMSKSDPDWFSDPIFDIDEAYVLCMKLSEQVTE